MGAPESVCVAELSSKARQVLTQYSGIQQTKNRTTITTNMRMTRFLASSLASDVLLRGLSALIALPDAAIADISIVWGRWTAVT